MSDLLGDVTPLAGFDFVAGDASDAIRRRFCTRFWLDDPWREIYYRMNDEVIDALQVAVVDAWDPE